RLTQANAVQPQLVLAAVGVPASRLFGFDRHDLALDLVNPVALAAVDLLVDAHPLAGLQVGWLHGSGLPAADNMGKRPLEATGAARAAPVPDARSGRRASRAGEKGSRESGARKDSRTSGFSGFSHQRVFGILAPAGLKRPSWCFQARVIRLGEDSRPRGYRH